MDEILSRLAVEFKCTRMHFPSPYSEISQMRNEKDPFVTMRVRFNNDGIIFTYTHLIKDVQFISLTGIALFDI